MTDFRALDNYTLVLAADGTVSFHGVEMGGKLTLHDIYRSRGAIRHLVVKQHAHARFGGRGMSRINEPGRMLDFKVVGRREVKPGHPHGTIAIFEVEQVSESYLRAWADPRRLAAIANEEIE